MRSSGYSGDCWGYEFDWEPHYASRSLPAGLPNVVATEIVSNALFEAYRAAGLETARDSCISSAEFVMHDLERTPGPNGSFCWGYFPGDRQEVLNATMKAARLNASRPEPGAVPRRTGPVEVFEHCDTALVERVPEPPASLPSVLDEPGEAEGGSFELGFSSHSHFTSAFRRAFGATPSAVRDRRRDLRTSIASSR